MPLLYKKIKIRILLKFLLFSVDNKHYKGADLEEFIENYDNIQRLSENISTSTAQKFEIFETVPGSVVYWEKSEKSILTIINCRNQFLLQLFKKYLETSIVKDEFAIRRTITFLSNFEDIIHPLRVDSYDDLNDNIFLKCIEGAESICNSDCYKPSTVRVVVFFQWLLTVLPVEVMDKKFKYINTVSLSYGRLLHCLASGYKLVKYSPYEEPKYFERMLLIPSSDESHIKGDSYRIYPFDISMVRNAKLREWYIDFFWEDRSHVLANRKKAFSSVRELIMALDAKTPIDSEEVFITESDILIFSSMVKSRNLPDSTKSFKLGIIKKFLLYLESKYDYKVNPLLYFLLTHKGSESNPQKEAYKSEEINKIIEYLLVKEPLYSIAVCILSTTEMRIESIIGLKVDCLKKSLTRKGHNEYMVTVHTKKSDNDIEQIPVNQYIKPYIDEVIRLTVDARKFSNSYDKDYLFLHLPRGKEIPRRIRQYSVTRKIREACRATGIEYKGSYGIRNFYMQSVSNHLSINNINPAITSALTGHTLIRHSKNYDAVNMRYFCEKYYHVNIGDVYLAGTVKKETELSDVSRVVENCGFCSEKHCILDGKLDCFMCGSFVTTVSCIPFYEEEIRKIDSRIVLEKLPHEKDFLLSKKKLLVGYLSQLKILKGGKR